jgi:hypothetical protein
VTLCSLLADVSEESTGSILRVNVDDVKEAEEEEDYM